MNRRNTIRCGVAALLITMASGQSSAIAGGPAVGVEAVARAARDAVQSARPFVVQVQAIGAFEESRGLKANGPTTGVYLPEAGCVVTSSYRIGGAAGLLVRFDNGARSPATLLATDTSRMLAVLKVAEPPDTPRNNPATIADPDKLQVGQSLVAVGRVYRADEPNLALGVLSAKRRLLGKAIQTDAAVSPANYGGPLLDLSGRIVGVLTPLAPSGGAGGADGTGWYDSGIGFAVPWPHVEQRLPKLLAGENIQRGLLGLSLQGGNPHTNPPVIAKVHPAGPVEQGGLLVGDRIMEVDGAPTSTKTAFRFALASRDAGDELKIAVERGEERLTVQVVLAAKLPEVPADQESGSDSNDTEESPPATSGNAEST